MKDKNKNKEKNSKKKKTWIGLCVLITITILITGVFTVNSIFSYNHVSIDKSDEALGINTMQDIPQETVPPMTPKPLTQDEIAEKESIKWNGQIINIALFGLDRRSSKEVGRSDSMMILTVDFQNNKIKLTSLMRDLDVPIENHGTSKLNHAYAYGGAELAIKTINQNFGTDIRNYVAVDFFTLEKVIDAIDGIKIDVKEKEIDMINKYIDETARIQNKKPTYLTTSGRQSLNGMQAVSYARIRYVGNGDFERTERQRNVLTEMIEKVRSEGSSAIPSLLLKVTPNIETSLDHSDILSMAYNYFKVGSMKTEQERFPIDGSWKAGRNKSGGWVMEVDMDEMKSKIQSYIYKDIDPTPDNLSSR
jgi:LCP family protein required for cell wall assembly